jgi:hypothetical protein
MPLYCRGQVHSRANNRASARRAASVPWRRALRRHLTTLLVIKVLALAVLWALFFSPVHRTAVDSQAVGRHLAAQGGTHD